MWRAQEFLSFSEKSPGILSPKETRAKFYCHLSYLELTIKGLMGLLAD